MKFKSKNGEINFTAKYGQWVLKADEAGFTYSNPAEDGTKRFFEYVSGTDNKPFTIAEPDLALNVPSVVEYVDSKGNVVTPNERIAGIICKKDGQVVHRFSLSNPNKPDFISENENSELVIDGVRWHLGALFMKDKNRIINYDAFYGDKKPDQVKIVELQDLEF